jgi:dihydroorotate dehydrogenase (fumarate)
MVDLSTRYLGMTLRNPLVVSASPLSRTLDTVRQLEDNGAAALVMDSLFEEEILHDQQEMAWYTEAGTESFAESLSYLPEHETYGMHGEDYLERLARLKRHVSMPIIASLNGHTRGGWVKYAQLFEQTGADAIELNMYLLATDPELPPQAIEQRYVDVLRTVRESVHIPVAVKMSPFFSSLAYTARSFEAAGADGLVLFNRFYQPDIDLEALDVRPNVLLSTPQAMRLPLRWIAILRDQLRISLAATSGIHAAEDVVKMLLVGADVTMMASALLRRGPVHVGDVLAGLERWLDEREYASVEQMKGSMSYRNVPDSGDFERANYIRALKEYR